MTFRDYSPLLEAFALVALVLLAAVLLAWYLQRRKRHRQAKLRAGDLDNIQKRLSQYASSKEKLPSEPALARHRPALQPFLSRIRGRHEPATNQPEAPWRIKAIGSMLLAGCQVVAWVFLIPWILSAALVWLFPGFSYGLVERWVCPPDSSIRVHGTGGWLEAVLSDDESVEFPQVTCVNSRGAVVFRGDSFENVFAYVRVSGVVLAGFLAILMIAFVLIAYSDRKLKTG